MCAPGRSPERSQAVPFVAEETSQEKLLALSRILHVEKRIGMTRRGHIMRPGWEMIQKYMKT
jgi:hypothetical protein